MTKAGSPAESFTEATPSGAWTFFTDPRAIQYQGKFAKTYLGFLDSAGSDRVWSLNHANGKIDTFTLHFRLQKDDHDNPALYMRKDGRLTAWYQRHGNDKFYLARTTLEPEDITAWDKEDTIPMPAGTTYCHPFRLDADSGKLYLFNRSIGFHPTMMSSKDEGKTWNTPVKMIGGSAARPYVKYISDGDSVIHIAFTDGHPRDVANNSIYYMRYCKGAFYHANGALIKTVANLPIEPSEADKVYDGATDGRAWIWDIALDGKNRPVLVHSVCPSETDHRYYYAYWTGTVWKDSLMTKAGGWFPQTLAGKVETEPHYSGGIILDPVDPSIVYLSKPTKGIFEIEKWSTANGGKSWTTLAITSGSTKHSARPVLPHPVKGQRSTHQILFWMSGDYIHYTNYATGIRYLAWEQPITIARNFSSQAKPSRAAPAYQMHWTGSLSQPDQETLFGFGWNLNGAEGVIGAKGVKSLNPSTGFLIHLSR